MLDDLNKKYKKQQDELARLDNKSIKELGSILYWTTWFTAISGLLFCVSVYFINNSRTNAGSGIAWFSSFITGLIFLSSFFNLIGIFKEKYKRQK
jgi:hypothetical protein